MKHLSLPLRFLCNPSLLRASFLLMLLFISFRSQAQKPTSLRYPPVVSAEALEDYVYLAPTVSGLVASYSISPALPAGLLFNTATGVISGVPTAPSPVANYTVTATNVSGTATSIISLQVINAYYNNNNNPVKFLGSTSEVKYNAAGSGVGGTHANDIVLYKNVVTIGGQQIDCIIKTVEVVNVASWAAYDQNAATGSGWSNNDPNFFSPQFNMGTGGGYVTFNFQYILGGSYNNATHTGTNVTLQNVKLNTYDVDGNGNTGSNQYNSFEGFSTAELSSNAQIVASYNTTTGLTRFTSTTHLNVTNILDSSTRVRVSYKNMSNFDIRVGSGANAGAWYFLDFSAGPTFTTAVITEVPSVDLNTNRPGNIHGRTGCGDVMAFTQAGQTNIAIPGTGTLNELSVSFPTTHILNGANEVLMAGSANIPLNANPAAGATATVGGVTYNVTGATVSNIRTINFSKNGGATMSLTEAEALLDNLQYKNAAPAPTGGERAFTVSVRNTLYRSPEAVFTASLNCVSLAGNIYRDANALTDNLVNQSSPTSIPAGFLTAVLTRQSDNKVYLTQAVAAGGAYSFGTATPGNYYIYFVPTTAIPVIGATFTQSVLPATPAGQGAYIFTGENLTSGAGHDQMIDGKLSVTLGTVSVTEANFGIQQLPTTANSSFNTANPMGYNYYTIPNAGFNVADADGTVDSIVITSFPANANYLKVGSTVYTNPSSGVCPPLSACTAWPGTLRVAMSGGNPVGGMYVDPSATGNTTVTIPFYALDNGRIQSNPNSTLTINFNVPGTPLTVSGNVWHDANGNGIKEGAEAFTAVAAPVQTLYAALVQTTNTYAGEPTVLYATTVSGMATGYSFSNVPAGNNYQVRIFSLPTAPVPGQALSALTPNLATGWTGVSTNNNGTVNAGQHTLSLVNTLNSFSASAGNVNFGIEQTPTANNISYNLADATLVPEQLLPLNGVLLPALSGSDPEDGALNESTLNRTIRIVSLPANGTLLYNGAAAPAGHNIPNFNPALLVLQLSGTGYTNTQFTYSYVDKAGVPAPAATYYVAWDVPLPVTLLSFDARPTGADALLEWSTAQEENNKGFRVEHSRDARTWTALGFIGSRSAAGNTSSVQSYGYRHEAPGDGLHYYRLRIEDLSGESSFSPVRQAMIKGTVSAVQLYPNPAKDQIYISGAAIETIQVTDLSGRMMQTAMTQQGNILTLQTAHFPAGIYVVKVTQQNIQHQFKVVIAR